MNRSELQLSSYYRWRDVGTSHTWRRVFADTNNLWLTVYFSGSGSRTYILAADTQEEMESWMKAITCANYDYMKLMVAELQRQLDEINNEPIVEQTDTTGHSSQNLVDLSVPDFAESSGSGADQSQSSQRRNPFGFVNYNNSSAPAGLDAFGATPFQPGTSGSSGAQGRTFKQMHEEFGKYIKGKMASYKNEESPLIDILGTSSV